MNYFDRLEKEYSNEKKQTSKTISQELVKEEALLKNVPILKDNTLKLILFLIKALNVKTVLEIGTAVGYSAMAMALQGCTVESVEINKEMYDKAINNINESKLENKIKVFYADALELDLKLLKSEYDLIFIDAAKAQYRKFFERFSPLLKPNGIIVIDNLLFHGYVDEYSLTEDVSGSRNLRGLARKIDNFNKWLITNDRYDTTFLEIGDGVALCIKK